MEEWLAWHGKTIAWGVGLIALAIGYTHFKKPPRQDFEAKSAAVRSFCLDIATKSFGLKLDPQNGEAVPFGSRSRYVSREGVAIHWDNRSGMPAVKCSVSFIQATPRIDLFELDGVNVTGKIHEDSFPQN